MQEMELIPLKSVDDTEDLEDVTQLIFGAAE